METENLEVNRLHSGYSHPVLRKWQSAEATLAPDNLMLPLFVIDNADEVQEISPMPGVSRMGVNKIVDYLETLLPLGLSSVLLFAVTDKPKDDIGSAGTANDNPALIATKMIKDKFGSKILVACDICLCPYASSGHCGVFDEKTGEIDIVRTNQLLAEMAGKMAQAGADVVAPSDMMDGRVKAIKDQLRNLGLDGKTSVLSYSSKFASCFYGPSREAAHSAPKFGDRKRYQLPTGSRGLAIRAADRDVEEGADMLMVKPGLAYLDIVREVKTKHPNHPMFVYQVSGEYAMIIHGSKAGAFDLQAMIFEVLTSMRRAGADVIISYFTPRVLQWLASPTSG